MTKRELYESAISIQKKLGQGLSGIVGKANSRIQDLLDELVEEGSLKLITQRNNYLPDDDWYFPVVGYCVFEDSDFRALSFVRMFLGQTELFLNFSYTEFIQSVEFMTAYTDWLTKNKEQLDIMINLDEEYKGEDVLFSEEEVEEIKSKDWFKNNDTVSKCLSASEKSLSGCDERISLSEQLIGLYTRKGDSEKEIEETKTDIENTLKEKKFRKRLHNYFYTLDLEKPIQEQFVV
ncbi:MAG: hypothetical protein ABFD07_07910 [Methanobacterium sp.]